jgi:hypothetical protein
VRWRGEGSSRALALATGACADPLTPAKAAPGLCVEVLALAPAEGAPSSGVAGGGDAPLSGRDAPSSRSAEDPLLGEGAQAPPPSSRAPQSSRASPSLGPSYTHVAVGSVWRAVGPPHAPAAEVVTGHGRGALDSGPPDPEVLLRVVAGPLVALPPSTGDGDAVPTQGRPLRVGSVAVAWHRHSACVTVPVSGICRECSGMSLQLSPPPPTNTPS